MSETNYERYFGDAAKAADTIINDERFNEIDNAFNKFCAVHSLEIMLCGETYGAKRDMFRRFLESECES